MTRKLDSTRPWLARLEERRGRIGAPVAGAEAKPVGVDGAPLPPREAVKPKIDPGLKLPAQLVADHGASLEGAIADLAAVAYVDKQLEPGRRKPFELAMKRFHTVLGLQLGIAPEAARPAIARASAAALKKLVEETGPSAHLVPALSAVVSLLDTGVRLQAKGKLAFGAEEMIVSADRAARAVTELSRALEGRAGISSALNVYSNLTEQLDFARPKSTAASREAAWGEVAKFLAESAPKSGFTPASSARIAEHLDEALDAGGVEGALERAHAACLGDVAAEREPVLAALGFAGAELAGDLRAVRVEDSGDPAHARESGGAGGGAGGARGPSARTGARDLAPGGSRDLAPEPRSSLRAPTIEGALASIVFASPAGPPELFAAVSSFSAAAAALELPKDELARVLSSIAASPAALETLRHLEAVLPAIAASAPARAALTKAAAGGADRLGSNLLRLQLALNGADAVPFNGSLAKLDGLSPVLRLEVAASVAPTLDPQLLDAAIHLARTAKSDAPFELLRGFATKFTALTAQLAAHPRLEPEKLALTRELARLANDGVVPHFPELLDALSAIKTAMPQVALAKLLETTNDGRIGLVDLVDPANDFRSPPLAFLPRLLEAGARPALGNAGLQAELARAAFEISANVGRLGKDPGPYAEPIIRDFAEAVRSPAKLTAPARAQNAIAARADQQQQGVAHFARSIPELPPEVVLTAGLHLSRDQLGWIVDRLAKNKRDLSGARACRDLIFGCVEADRTDVIDALRTSQSPPKVIRAVIDRLARAFRLRELSTLPLDSIITGLKAGRDPLADIARATDAGGLAGVHLGELTGGRVTTEGRDELTRIASNINYYLGLYVPGGATYDADIDMPSLRPIFLDSIKSVANGTWPAPKYENEAGLRQMAILSADQRAVWRSSLVTPMVEAANPAEDPGIRDALVLLEGLLAALPGHVELHAEGLPHLGFDHASIDNLNAVRELAIEDLRQFEKGTPDHSRLKKQLAEVQENLSILELHRALEQTVGAGRTDPAEIMLRLRPALENAITPLAKRGGAGFRETVDRILFATQDLKSSPREGRYASDEDNITAMATSNVSGCLAPHWPGGPGRQWGIAGAVADANVRMLRVYNDDHFVCRGFMKFFEAEFPGYKGPVMYLDIPVADGGGGDDDFNLWFRHAINKAAAMGVPVISGAGNYDKLNTLGTSLGLTVHAGTTVRFHVDEGNTGYMHSDTMFAGKGNIRASRGENKTWDFDQAVGFIVMPPKAGG